MNEEKISYIIDTWYFNWKERITVRGEPHNLGFAKEELKKEFEKEVRKQIIIEKQRKTIERSFKK